MKEREFYNADIKNQYLSNYINTNEKLAKHKRDWFYKIAEIETLLDKDVAYFSENELMQLFSHHHWGLNNTFITIKANIKNYIEWYKKYIPNSDNVDISVITNFRYSEDVVASKFANEYFKDYNELVDCFNEAKFYNEFDDDRTIFTELFFSLIWFQIPIQFIMDIQVSDVDFNNHCIIIENEKYSVNQYVINLCEIAIHNEGAMINGKFIRRKQDGHLIKVPEIINLPEGRNERNIKTFTDSQCARWRKMKTKFPETHKYYNKSLKVKAIANSGLFCSILEYEQQMGKSIRSIPYKEYSLVFPTLTKDWSIKGVKSYVSWRKLYYPELSKKIGG